MNNYALRSLTHFLSNAMPWWSTFAVALIAALVLVPIVREINRHFGLVDQPSARRINTKPIPRGGGLGIYIAVLLASIFYLLVFQKPFLGTAFSSPTWAYWIPPTLLVVVGYVDDKYGLPPLVKLGGQILAAATAVFLCHFGFSAIFPGLPFVLDALFTIFWLVGAINAFNLIDGLDGLATGLAAIAVMGMGGALFCIGHADDTIMHFALLGGLLGFLCYNFNPASVFLGDCGSMFIGYMVALLPLTTRSSNSFLVGMGIPLLAMGVPIFDTSLAILRRTVRAILRNREEDDHPGNDRVMTADTDHLHHRILRSVLSQRKAAIVLYTFALLLVLIGLGGLLLQGRAVSLFIVGFMAVAYIIFRDMRRIELWDAGRLLNAAVRNATVHERRRQQLLGIPFLVISDLIVLVGAWLMVSALMALPIDEKAVGSWLILRAVPIFLALYFFRAYHTVWSRAMLSNYVRLIAAVLVGSALTCALVILIKKPASHLTLFTTLYAISSMTGLFLVRLIRPIVRDFFYALDAGHLTETSTLKRVVVYGGGLRYRAFRRELVRHSAHGNRVIVGILDDDILLRGHYIGGIRIWGTLEQAPGILKRLQADEVVVTACLTPQRREIARQIFAAADIPATQFTFTETEL